MTKWFTTIASPIGTLHLVKSACGLTNVTIEAQPAAIHECRRDAATFVKETQQLEEYFFEGRTHFELELAPLGTAFQHSAWAALVAIPFGETRSYAAQARTIGKPKAVRAVGSANARNPIAIIVPCHRVIGSEGALVGFASGVARKRWLLDHEQRYLRPRLYAEMIGTPSCVST